MYQMIPLLQAASGGSKLFSGGGSGLIFILLIILVFYFFMIRPQQKRQKNIEAARNSLKKGDHVVTIGGVHGKITDEKANSFVLEVAPDVRIEVDKNAISITDAQIQSQKSSKKQEKQDK